MTLSTQHKPQVKLKPEFVAFIKRLFFRETSAFQIVYGRRDLGKTDFALLLFEILHLLNIRHFATNIEITDSYFPIEEITNLQDLKLWCKNTHGKKVFGFDEAGKAIRRRSPMSTLNIKLLDEFQILRKYQLSIIACTVSPKFIDNAALGDDILDGYFAKKRFSKDLMKCRKVVLYHDNLDDSEQPFRNIPPTLIKFNTWGTAPFTEKAPIVKPHYKDKDMDILWLDSHGAPLKELPCDKMYISRLRKKFIREVLERECNK